MELMNQVKVTNTGRFNYHLKVLGDLIEKMSDGRYKLTERGQIAVQLLERFPQKSVRTENQPITVLCYTPIWAKSRRRELGLIVIDVTLAQLALYLFLFGFLFLRRPWPYGPISVEALSGIILSAGFLLLDIAVHRKYLEEKARNKNLPRLGTYQPLFNG